LGLLDTRQAFARLSPTVLFNEIVAVVLDPSVRSTQQSMLAALGLALIERGAIPDAPIPLVQSVLIVWPQIVGLAAGSILLFVAAYIVFHRQEVRAWSRPGHRRSRAKGTRPPPRGRSINRQNSSTPPPRWWRRSRARMR